jgi:pyruvate/2-oxoglutarate dehydrogenase complex dihydrolipoamide dehydrogenase (E3) component
VQTTQALAQCPPDSVAVLCVLWMWLPLPATRTLNLEAAGIVSDAAGVIETDPFLNTSAPGVYAVSEATSLPATVAPFCPPPSPLRIPG